MAAIVPALPTRFTPVFGRSGLRGGEALLEVGDDVVDVLQPDGQAHQPGRDPGGHPGVVTTLRVRRRGGVDDERAHVTDVGYVAVQRQRLDELLARLEATLDLEGEHRA